MYLWGAFQGPSSGQLATPFRSIASRSVSWFTSGNLIRYCDFSFWCSMPRAKLFLIFFFWLWKSNNIPVSCPHNFAHDILATTTDSCITTSVLLLVVVIMLILPGNHLYCHLTASNPWELILIDIMQPGCRPSFPTVNESQKRTTITKLLKYADTLLSRAFFIRLCEDSVLRSLLGNTVRS